MFIVVGNVFGVLGGWKVCRQTKVAECTKPAEDTVPIDSNQKDQRQEQQPQGGRLPCPPFQLVHNWQQQQHPSAPGQGIFGLEPVNYATAAAPAICASPPPPKPGLAKYTFPISALLTIGVTAYFYVNNQNDSFAYWESMQTGGIPEDDDDDIDDDLDDEEE